MGKKQNGFVSWICGKRNISATSNLKYCFVAKQMDLTRSKFNVFQLKTYTVQPCIQST